MAAKRFNQKKVYFKDNNGEEHEVCLFTTKTRNYTTEHAYCPYADKEGTYKWYNRPWESFDYEQAMLNMIEKLPKAWRETATKTLIDRIEDEETKRLDEMEKSFMAAHDSLSENGKAFFAEHAPIMNTEEDVRVMTGLMALASLMGM